MPVSPIPRIVAEVGWPGFRDLEEEVVRTFATRDGLVLDCGGGVVEREANFAVLRRAGPVIWLTASVATIVQRIAGDSQRPSLTGTKSFTDEVAEVLAAPHTALSAHLTLRSRYRFPHRRRSGCGDRASAQRPNGMISFYELRQDAAATNSVTYPVE